MFRLATYIITALVVLLLLWSRVDGGMIHTSAPSDALRSPAREDFAPSSDKSVLPTSVTELPRWNMFGTISPSTLSVGSGPVDVKDTAAIQGEIFTAPAINARDLQGGLAQWIQPKSFDLNSRSGIIVETWHDAPLALTPQAYAARSPSSTEPLSRLVSYDYESPSRKLPLETVRDQGPVIMAVGNDAAGFATFLSHNNALSRLVENLIPRDTTATVTEVVTRMLKDGDDHQSLNGRDEIAPRIATCPG